jgi:hypothetical protein
VKRNRPIKGKERPVLSTAILGDVIEVKIKVVTKAAIKVALEVVTAKTAEEASAALEVVIAKIAEEALVALEVVTAKTAEEAPALVEKLPLAYHHCEEKASSQMFKLLQLGTMLVIALLNVWTTLAAVLTFTRTSLNLVQEISLMLSSISKPKVFLRLFF